MEKKYYKIVWPVNQTVDGKKIEEIYEIHRKTENLPKSNDPEQMIRLLTHKGLIRMEPT